MVQLGPMVEESRPQSGDFIGRIRPTLVAFERIPDAGASSC